MGLVCALALLSIGASCSGARNGETSGEGSGSGSGEAQQQGGSRAPSGPRVERLEAVDLGDLTAAERRVWVDLVNALLSPCGEPVSVARCADEGRACRTCVPAARYVSRLIAEGYERSEIEELYELRYGRDTAVEVQSEGFPMRGAPMAPVTIVEFSDFECPYCGRAHPLLAELLRDFEGQVKVVFRNYPLSGHPRAMPAARAAVAAGQQGKFWEMADLLFEHQRALEDEDLERYAQQLGLDMERFHADLHSPETQAAIERDREEGRRLNVEGTPTFFVNGRRFREPPTSLPAYVREELDQ
ncbi:DsbA family protein [Sandaracinus amylolyticus]|uniref:Na+/H+ antiporter NhaA type n=1 Tax=Sandaracinus amylolyticus TaxID=927083 RepID=A0A0F6YIZ6_9BACT|nr:thioredoxin domain-containing protein [Sandaracinus amylolyticus]AKF06338.1 Na+/H+ antiporter NhaA type [Sandaracinus amylolyticus]